MPIQLIDNPGLEYQIINCPGKGKLRDMQKDDCCNTCSRSDRIYTIEDIAVGLYCKKKKRVVDWKYKCSKFSKNKKSLIL